MKFKAQDGKMVFVLGNVVTFKKGCYETTSKDEIEALGKAKGVTKVEVKSGK